MYLRKIVTEVVSHTKTVIDSFQYFSDKKKENIERWHTVSAGSLQQ